MFSQANTNSPYRSSQPSQGYGTPQGSASFSQQQTSSGLYHSASHQQNQGGFSGPQFGGGNSQFGGSGGGGGSNGFGNQFGAGGNAGSGAGYGSPFGQNNMQNSVGGGSSGTPGFGEGKKRNYLPGYLSGGAAAQPESTSPQPMNSDSWDSPARKASLSSSPVARFGGGGSLFGSVRDNTPSKSPKFAPYAASPRNPAYRNEMDEDAPPTASLNEFEHAEPSNSADTNYAAHRETFSNSPFSGASSSLHAPPPASSSSSSSSATYAVNIFGFPTSALDLVLDYFSQFGDIVSKSPSTEGGNWVTIEYSQPWSAARAARKNGEILGGVLMVGVKVIDDDGLKRALMAAESGGEVSSTSQGHSPGTGTPRPVSAAQGGGGGSSMGRPVQVFGPGSAFKAAPTPTKKGFLGLGVGGGGTPQQSTTSSDPHASLFAEKSKQAAMQQGNQGQKGMLGKVSDLVFGW
ncbi:uncharacterized protein JCM6883_005780 [Sporobolomyces salmoneus]|uniref:uncharacterized protein n=1 Tax=Sporobolomyces salmoneus TaxID=183962 RepID=UPI00317A188D